MIFPVGKEGSIIGCPSPLFESQHQKFVWASPLAARAAKIDYLLIVQFLLVLEGVLLSECIFSPQLMLRVDDLCRFYDDDNDDDGET